MSTILVYIDGSARPNPGKGGIGIVFSGDKLSYTTSEPLVGKVTNNEAEYQALSRALTELDRSQCCNDEIIIYSDSEMLTRQMKGERFVDKGGKYFKPYQYCKVTASKFKNLTFVWIPREHNSEANMQAYRIKGLDVNGSHSNKCTDKKIWVGQTHKHEWSEVCPDGHAYSPNDITGDTIETVLKEFSQECNIVFKGSFTPVPIRRRMAGI